MSALDMLLGESAAKLSERPEKELEIKRLSDLFGQPFVVQLRGLTMRELDDLPKGDDFKTHVVVRGTVEPDLKSAALAEKFKPQGRKTALLPQETAQALFLPGEIMALYNAITELSGFGDTAVEEIKKK